MKELHYQNNEAVETAYGLAKAAYAAFGVNTDKAIKAALNAPLSIHCWQGDDVTGFEGQEELSGGGIMTTGNYPGKARNGDELRSDAEFAFGMIPGKKRFNLHSFYAETGGKKVGRDELEPEHFSAWMKWSRKKKIPLDFNPSYFSHPLAEEGTLSASDPKVRRFWINHGIACQKITEAFAENQGSPSVVNIWASDGCKDYPADRLSPRLRMKESLDEILAVKTAPGLVISALESKLFGTGLEAYTVGSHEFCMGYAAQRYAASGGTDESLKLCFDMGHFHPTETISDKISAAMLFVPGILIHFSRPMRWDSDHVALYNDDMRDVCHEIYRNKFQDKINFALDFFDASINRIAAWVIGSRSIRKAMLESLVEPVKLLVDAENKGRLHERLALMEEFKTLPFAAVWDKLCLEAGVPLGADWLAPVGEYEKAVLLKRK